MTDARVAVSGNRHTGILHLTGELDALTAPDLEQRLMETIAKLAAKDLTLDLSELSFMDSTGLHLLIQIAQKLEGGGKLILLAPAGIVRRVLGLTQLERVPNLEVR